MEHTHLIFAPLSNDPRNYTARDWTLSVQQLCPSLAGRTFIDKVDLLKCVHNDGHELLLLELSQARQTVKLCAERTPDVSDHVKRLSMSSSSKVPANDQITLRPALSKSSGHPPNYNRSKTLTFHPQSRPTVLWFTSLIRAYQIVSPKYQIANQQCYHFAGMIYTALNVPFNARLLHDVRQNLAAHLGHTYTYSDHPGDSAMIDQAMIEQASASLGGLCAHGPAEIVERRAGANRGVPIVNIEATDVVKLLSIAALDSVKLTNESMRIAEAVRNSPAS